ncbi:efflux RND transporter periplasmic adaptor subunit [Paraburkholderia elongata]|uniref:Efflux RND transporter periplasmic adaptor subunit n=1 Tax=Paraburkholderia elongata TaxID=2675747 RepID=A0A972NNX7_9BURK|nr:HlyD family secretion protein [Paraburkholderia elongata]NPT55010.1 efflux RND transporter periplasmic adaptor subunit [Paraburkholderia elongata]
MFLRKTFGLLATVAIFAAAIIVGRVLWVHYMDEPWTRDGRVRADIVTVAPDVSGALVTMPVRDNQFVHKGDLIMEIDPSHYRIAVQQAQATVDERKTELQMRKDDAARRADMDSEVVSRENRDNANHIAAGAAAQLEQAEAELAAAELNLDRTRVVAPVDGYITNLNTHRGDYAVAGSAKLAIVDSNSFWVYGYFEETKLPHVQLGDKASVVLMSGGKIQGHVESISRGIYDRDNPESRELLADVNPTFNWVRLAQRVPVRIRIDKVPSNVMLSAGTTCAVTLTLSP